MVDGKCDSLLAFICNLLKRGGNERERLGGARCKHKTENILYTIYKKLELWYDAQHNRYAISA